MHTVKTQVSLYICVVLSASLLVTLLIHKNPMFLYLDSRHIDQTVWMHRLIWVFVALFDFVGFVIFWLIWDSESSRNLLRQTIAIALNVMQYIYTKKNLLIWEKLFLWENECLWLFKISTDTHFIPLQSMVCVSYHCRNEMSTPRLPYNLYDRLPSFKVMKPSKSDPFCCYDNTVWCHTISAMVWNVYHAPQWYEMHTSANFEKIKTHIFSNK